MTAVAPRRARSGRHQAVDGGTAGAADIGAAWEPCRPELPRFVAAGLPALALPAPDPALERIARLAALAMSAPIAVVSLAGDDRQWISARRGLEVAPVVDETGFRDPVLRLPAGMPLVVPDAAADARFAEMPLVQGDLGIRFYAGAAIRGRDGAALGTLCVLDTRPRLGVQARDAAVLTELAELAREEFDRCLARTEIGSAARATARQGRRTDATLAAVLQATADAVLAIDADGCIRAANPGAEALFGYGRGGLSGRPVASLVPVRAARALGLALGRCLRMADPRQLGAIEMSARCRDGTELTVELSVAACAIDGARGLGVVLRPASLRKAANAERQSRRAAAVTAARTRSDVLANMSHELRTPLNAIIGFSELLLDELQGPVNNRQRDYLAGIHRSGSHLLAIVNDILDFAKIEAGRIALDERPIEVAKLIQECAALLALQAANAGVELQLAALPPGLPRILGDERLLKQVLLNLLSNAVKFTASGGRVTLSAAIAGDNGMTVEITDTGIGMAPDEIEVALEAFRQVDSSLTRRHDGTGLGLPIAKKLTELHGGRLVFASQPRHGTTVAMQLPASRVVADA